MPLKIYRQKLSKKATVFINLGDGRKDIAIDFTGGMIVSGESTGCYITSDENIQSILEKRPDFMPDRFESKGNFYLENSILTEDELNAENVAKEKAIESENIIDEVEKEFQEQLSDMVKEALKIPVEEENTEAKTILTEATEQTTTETTEKAAEDLSYITNYQAAKSYLMKNCGATPDDVKNKESLLAYCEKNQINLPNFK